MATADAATSLWNGRWAGTVLIVGGVGGILTSWNAFIIGGSRVMFALSESGFLPASFSRLHPRYKTPYVGIWVLGFLTVLRLRPFLLVRKWRYVLGTALIATAALAVLTQIEGEMPLIGTANLGGSLGLEAIGRARLTGWGTAAASTLVGIWLMLPRFSNAALSRSAQGARQRSKPMKPKISA